MLDFNESFPANPRTPRIIENIKDRRWRKARVPKIEEDFSIDSGIIGNLNDPVPGTALGVFQGIPPPQALPSVYTPTHTQCDCHNQRALRCPICRVSKSYILKHKETWSSRGVVIISQLPTTIYRGKTNICCGNGYSQSGSTRKMIERIVL